MTLDWLDASEAVKFAKEIAREVGLLFPLNPQKSGPDSRLRITLDTYTRQANGPVQPMLKHPTDSPL